MARGIYLLDYRAPLSHYCAASEPVFEEAVRSFRFLS
jgi:hypothetical protein